MMPMARLPYATHTAPHPRWRWLLIAAAALLLIACRAPDTRMTGLQNSPLRHETSTAANQPDAASSGARQSLSDNTSRSAPKSDTRHDRSVMPAQHMSPGPAAADEPGTTRGPGVASVRATKNNRQTSRTPIASAAPRRPWPHTAQAPVAKTQYPSPCPSRPHPAVPRPRPDAWCPNGIPCEGWRPPGLSCPWPKDEYLCDGGDQIPTAKVREDWRVDGLQLEDTVVHYDTLDGDTHVEPSNRVCIYAPRFAAVRKVHGVCEHDYLNRVARVDQPLGIEGVEDAESATTSVQPVQPVLTHGSNRASKFLERTPPVGLENREGLSGLFGKLLPHEGISELQDELVSNAEKARLAAMNRAAATWSRDAAVQVVIDNIATHEDVATTEIGTVVEYSLKGKSRLRVCKLASTDEAQPGETVEFTLKFENVGDQKIGNVTVIDNLSTRLEYVAESETCSVKANFSTAENSGESLRLRWEIIEPLDVGEGGTIRFTCRVR